MTKWHGEKKKRNLLFRPIIIFLASTLQNSLCIVLKKSLFSVKGVPQADMSQLPVVLNREFLGKPNFGNLGVFLVLPYSCVHTFSFPHHWSSETSAAGSASELCDVDSPSTIQLFCNSSREENILFSRDMMVGT